MPLPCIAAHWRLFRFIWKDTVGVWLYQFCNFSSRSTTVVANEEHWDGIVRCYFPFCVDSFEGHAEPAGRVTKSII